MLNALRLADGVPTAMFPDRTGLPASAIQEPLERAEQRGLIEADPVRIRPTALGRRFLTDLQSLFLPAGRT
jgi:oxygen-independent coproporphyrinogen-3 oxidase